MNTARPSRPCRGLGPMVAATAFLVVSGCAAPRAELDDAWSDAIRDSVSAQLVAIADDLAARGPSAWLDHFEHSPRFFMASDGAVLFPTIDAARTFLEGFAPTIAAMRMTWQESRIEPLAPGRAMAVTRYDEILTDTAGVETRYAGVVTALAVHAPAGWRLQHLHWSSAASGPAVGNR